MMTAGHETVPLDRWTQMTGHCMVGQCQAKVAKQKLKARKAFSKVKHNKLSSEMMERLCEQWWQGTGAPWPTESVTD